MDDPVVELDPVPIRPHAAILPAANGDDSVPTVGNDDYMLTELQIEKWLSGRLGDWFEQVEVFVDREEITIMRGRLTAQDTDDEMALVGRITTSVGADSRTADRYRTRTGARDGQEGELGRAVR